MDNKEYSPKEKAEELVYIFRRGNSGFSRMSDYNVIQCAIASVEDTLTALRKSTYLIGGVAFLTSDPMIEFYEMVRTQLETML